MSSDVPYCVVFGVLLEEPGGEFEDFEGVLAFCDLVQGLVGALRSAFGE